MAEPDNIVLDHLRPIRAEVGEVKQRIAAIERQLETKAEAAQVADLDSKLAGFSHMVISSLGSIVRSLDALDRRVARLEHASV